MMAQVLQGSTAKQGAGGGGIKYWTCSKGGDDHCFAAHRVCHKCGEPRTGHSESTAKVAKTKAAKDNPKAEREEMDLTDPDVPVKTLGGQIAELGAMAKGVKAVKDSDKGEALLEGWEMDLQDLREQQKHARPLPARLEAATARSANTKATLEEATNRAATLREHLRSPRRRYSRPLPR